MQTQRVTILMTPEKKAIFDAMAAGRGISTGEFFRRAGDRVAGEDADGEARLALVAAELEAAVPAMRADIDAMRTSIAEARAAIAAYRAEQQAEARRSAA